MEKNEIIMENKIISEKITKIKCSLPEHENYEAIFYCQQCKIYMCNKCDKVHSGLCLKHSKYNLEKDIKEIFTGFCKEEKHCNILEYYCKNHNTLCCAACISKIKGKGNGQHTDCEIYFIEDIKNEKKNNLKRNIQILKELSNSFSKSMNELKIIFEKITEKKETLKLNIQKIFTNIRNSLNNREDELLLEVDKKFEDKYFKEELIKDCEKLPNRIKESLEKGQIIDKDWEDNNKINILINDSINIENNINEINIINSKLKVYNSKNLTIKFSPKENEISDFLNSIKDFGKIYFNFFKFKKCPMNIAENKKYIIIGEDENILKKTGPEGYMGTICDCQLDKGKIHKWKIKIINSKGNYIDVGVAPIDFDINSATENNSGWYFACDNSKLYSGQPHNYSGLSTNLKKVKDEITIVMDMNKGSMKFIIDNEDKGDQYTNILLDKPLSPAILLKDTNDSISIMEC